MQDSAHYISARERFLTALELADSVLAAEGVRDTAGLTS